MTRSHASPSSRRASNLKDKPIRRQACDVIVRASLEQLESRRLLCSLHTAQEEMAIALHVTPDVNTLQVSRSGADRAWQALRSLPAAPAGKQSYLHLSAYTPFAIDARRLKSTLATAPTEFTAAGRSSPLVMSLPTPDGTLARFRVTESPILSPEDSARFPGIKTYIAQGIDDPAAQARLDFTDQGFHAQVISANGTFYIDPYYHLDQGTYVSYYKRDAISTGTFTEIVGDQEEGLHAGSAPDGELDTVVGTELRTYRAAISATGEYTAYHGGTQALGLSAVTTAMNRISGVYETDFAVRMVLIANESNLIFTNAATDPFTSPSSPSTSNSQNQTYIDTNIGNANYDIGHVFHRGSDNGLAGAIGNVGVTGQKAKGYSSHSNPINDPFTIDYVAHEMGHQFGGRHNFNNCNGSQGDSSSLANEPGSGSAIMSYAGICGSTNLQAHSDAMFNSINFDQIVAYTTSGVGYTAAQKTATGNTIPTVEAGPNYNIPANTPFALTAIASDANGDTLTYSWEQRDGGGVVTVGTDPGFGPIIRPWVPDLSPTRTIPRLSNLVNNTSAFGERTPGSSRSLSFTVQVRDNRAGGGASATDNMSITVTNTGAAFAISSPNTSGLSFNGGSTLPVAWNVANTTAAPISTANVSIKLSLDGGFTYPITLASGTANDGAENVQLPFSTGSTQARIRVEAVGNIFFDINNFNFTLVNIPDVPAPGQPALLAVSDSGISSSDGITNFDNSTPARALQFDVPGTADGDTVVILANGVQIGSAIAAGATTTVITDGSTTLANGVRNITARRTPSGGSQSLDSPLLQITIDTLAPSLVGLPGFQYATAPHGLVYGFSENVGPTLGVADLLVTQLPATAVTTSLSYDGGTNVATFTFPGFANGVVADGQYTATLTAAGVTDVAGNAMAANSNSSFFFLMGDADHNGVVNLEDFNILAANFGLAGDFTQGDFDYNGVVNLEDFNIFASQFGAAVAPGSVAGRGAPSPFGRSPITDDTDQLLDQLA